MGKSSQQLTEKLIQRFLDLNGLEGANFFETPRRVAKMWQDFLNKPKPELRAFPTDSQEMVILKNYVTWGFCPHHLLPVRYTFKIGYIPQDKVLGLSKLARLADWCLSKLPLQEDLPNIVLKELKAVIRPLGCGCQVKGWHLCMVMRGVKAEQAQFVSTALSGVMLYSPSAQQEFLTT